MSQSDPVDRRAPDARVVRVPHQERPARADIQASAPAAKPESVQERVVVLRTDRPVPRRVAAERRAADDGSSGGGLRQDEPASADGEAHTPRRARSDDPAAGPDRELVRRVHDDRTGGDWRVFERDARLIPGSRGPRCLYFDGEGIVRRVWDYPTDWPTLSAAALLALMDRPPLGRR